MIQAIQPSKFIIFAKFVRLQFTPIMIAPVVLGAASAWYMTTRFEFINFLLALLGSISLHLAANAIDDVYDHLSGVDTVSDRIFPKDFPGWKPLTRGMISIRRGFEVSGIFYGLSLIVGAYLSVTVGWPALGIALPGIILSYVYAAPPIKLDYRGLGLGEVSIFLSFGPIPCLGTYYVVSHSLSLLPILISVPTGLLTTNVLLSHDRIFFDAYKEAEKRSLAIVLGLKGTSRVILALGVSAYALVSIFALTKYVPIFAISAFATIPAFVGVLDLSGSDEPPPARARRTMKAFLGSVTFTLLLSLGLLL